MHRLDLVGAWLEMDKSAHLAYLAGLARSGFVVASVEYRTSNEAKFPKQLEDVKSAIRYLRAHADRFCLDPEHFGVMGESAGGYLAAMTALATDPGDDVGDHLSLSSAVSWLAVLLGIRHVDFCTMPPKCCGFIRNLSCLAKTQLITSAKLLRSAGSVLLQKMPLP